MMQTNGPETAIKFWHTWHHNNPNVPGETMLDRMCKFAEDYAVYREKAAVAKVFAEEEK